MEKITNLEDAKNIAIGKCFIFGMYQGESIVWKKIDENLAISDKTLDCIVFNDKLNNKYDESIMRIWCNDILGKKLGLSEDTLFVLNKDEFIRYFSTNELRETVPTEWAVIHGIDVDNDGHSPYWTSSPSTRYDIQACYILGTGEFHEWCINSCYIGVRPALKLD